MKGAITLFELALLAIVTTVLVLIYQVVAQTTVENIILRTSNSIQRQECSMALLTLFGQDYIRNKYVDINGSYLNLSDFYNLRWVGIPEEFQGLQIEYGSKLGAKCIMYVYDPYSLYAQKEGYEVISGV